MSSTKFVRVDGKLVNAREHQESLKRTKLIRQALESEKGRQMLAEEMASIISRNLRRVV